MHDIIQGSEAGHYKPQTEWDLQSWATQQSCIIISMCQSYLFYVLAYLTGLCSPKNGTYSYLFTPVLTQGLKKANANIFRELHKISRN